MALIPALPLHASAAYSLNCYGGQYVSVPGNTNLTPTPLTFEAWVNVPSPGAYTILSRGDGGNGSITDYIFQIGGDGVAFGTQVCLFGVGGWDASTSGIPTNAWTHVAVTFDGTNKLFYINGALSGTAYRPGPLYQSGSTMFLVRQGTVCNCNYLVGQLAEVRIWNTVRTATQIAGDMSLSSGGQPGLVAYYHLNEGSGTNAFDASGNGYNGTVAVPTGWTNSGPPFAGIALLGTTNRLEVPAAGMDSVVLWNTNGWTATANAPWLHLSAANQSGNGSTNVIFSFDANTGGTRTGTLTIAGQTLTVTQAGATYVAVPPRLTTLAGYTQGLLYPAEVAVDEAGNVYVVDSGVYAVFKWVAASNSVIGLVSSGLTTPWGLALDSANNVYIGDGGDNAIKEWVAASNTVVTLVSGLNSPRDMALDRAGNIYFANTGDGTLKEWLAASNTLSTLNNLAPIGVALDVAGNVYFASGVDDTIRELLAANNSVSTLASSGIYLPYGVAVDGAGNVYFIDLGAGTIKEWSAVDNTVTILYSGLYRPYGVAVDAVGNVYVSDYGFESVFELPRAFVDPTPKGENAGAGSDTLPVVLPATENLRPPFAPTSDAGWLTVQGVSNGVVRFAFTGNAGSVRTGHITVLGQPIPVTQAAGTPPTLRAPTLLGNGSFQFAFTNVAGVSFTVLSSTNLALPLTSWTSMGAPTENPPGQYQFTDTQPTHSVRFYILRSP